MGVCNCRADIYSLQIDFGCTLKVYAIPSMLPGELLITKLRNDSTSCMHSLDSTSLTNFIMMICPLCTSYAAKVVSKPEDIHTKQARTNLNKNMRIFGLNALGRTPACYFHAAVSQCRRTAIESPATRNSSHHLTLSNMQLLSPCQSSSCTVIWNNQIKSKVFINGHTAWRLIKTDNKNCLPSQLAY